MFLLRKWYLDVVTDEGTAVILYAAGVRWGGFRTGYAAVLCAEPGQAPSERATIRKVERPRRDGDALTWESVPLGVRGRWRRAAREDPPIRRTLAQGPTGTIRWTCHMPRARASIQLGSRTLEGLGYVESLRLTIPPWRLPFRTLRWGRHASDRHSLVWIDWTGGREIGNERRWVWLDGLEQSGVTMTDAGGLSGLAAGAELRLESFRDVRDRRVLATLTDFLPGLCRRLAGPLAGMHEHKMLDRSSIVEAEGGRPPDRGWTLHEVVTW